jgi:hypothetical protein
MNLISKSTTVTGAWVLLMAGALIVNAQKLPNIQQSSVLAPANIKIDGKPTEWNDQFKAYNKATDIYYTVSNDGVNLYLTVQAQYQDVIDKIIRGGITFTVNHTINKKDDAAVVITYPVIRGADMALVTNLLAGKCTAKNGAASTAVPVDDFNQLWDAKSKIIGIKGIKALADEGISVYNDDGIKAAAQLDNRVFYTYELAIPLKFLHLPNQGGDAFSYHIKVNEPADVQVYRPSGSAPAPPPPPMMLEATVPTDFWGEYVLARK